MYDSVDPLFWKKLGWSLILIGILFLIPTIAVLTCVGVCFFVKFCAVLCIIIALLILVIAALLLFGP